ncbi:transcription antitermination factor NusB [Mycoplasmatota bacterium WC30]
MRRSEFREKVVFLLYIKAINGEFQTDEYSKEILVRFEDIHLHLNEIDEMISNNLIGYTIDRLNYVDLAIVRNAVYEMMFTKLPTEIAINEAINLTKKFTNLDDDASKRFNNKLLDTIKNSLKR